MRAITQTLMLPVEGGDHGPYGPAETALRAAMALLKQAGLRFPVFDGKAIAVLPRDRATPEVMAAAALIYGKDWIYQDDPRLKR